MEMKILQPIFGILVVFAINELMKICNEPGNLVFFLTGQIFCCFLICNCILFIHFVLLFFLFDEIVTIQFHDKLLPLCALSNLKNVTDKTAPLLFYNPVKIGLEKLLRTPLQRF